MLAPQCSIKLGMGAASSAKLSNSPKAGDGGSELVLLESSLVLAIEAKLVLLLEQG